MNTSTTMNQKSVPQAQTVATAKVSTRLDYLDTLRAILIILVIALHTAITYGALGDWTFIDPGKSELAGILLTFVTTAVQAFSLGLYFFISGFFTPRSYDRKGPLTFWKDRLLRLALPMILYTFLLSKIPQYIANKARGDISDSFWSFSRRTFISGADEGPTWFIFALLLFLIVYTIWRLAAGLIPSEKLAWTRKLKTPGKKEILAFGVVVGLLMFIVGLESPINNTVAVFGIYDLMIIFFAQYILFFIAGLFACRNDWIAQFNGRDLRFWTILTLGLFLMMPVLFFAGGAASGSGDYFLGGLYWQSAVFMLWVGLFSVSISMTLILSLRDRKQPQNRVLTFAGANSYGVYLIHPLILIPVAVAMATIALDPLLKFVIVLPVVVVICFLVADVLRRIPGVKAVL